MIIKIGAHDYSVVDLTDADYYVDRLYGRITYGTETIEISPRVSASKYPAVLLHEILHGIWTTYGPHKAADDDEQMIIAFEEGLSQVFRDNPHLKDILFPKEKKNARTKS